MRFWRNLRKRDWFRLEPGRIVTIDGQTFKVIGFHAVTAYGKMKPEVDQLTVEFVKWRNLNDVSRN